MKKLLKKWLFKPLILELQSRKAMHEKEMNFAAEQLKWTVYNDNEDIDYFTQYQHGATQRLSEVNHILEIVKKQIS